ncbi:MAG: uroporphyrinogen-III synthase [Gammaproteobacteria bacterium]|nr:uroporphyrinogen-III synthase [Gammaproteobacteria bacterium]
MNKYIMITRPAHQSEKLVEGINAAGGDTFLFPTLAIEPIPLSNENFDKVKLINHFHMIIFISPNAVEHGLNYIRGITQLSNEVLLATIGQGSARALEAYLGKKPDIVPDENFNSEGLLATRAMQEVKNKRILIVRGNGGRELLKQTLVQRGALVEYLDAYQRVKPVIDTHELVLNLQNNQIAAIVITSTESLKNLVDMTPEKVRTQLLQLPLLLINNRLIDTAKEAGFNGELYVANEASDKAIIETLKLNNLLS